MTTANLASRDDSDGRTATAPNHAKRDTAHCQIVRQHQPTRTRSDDKNIPICSIYHLNLYL
jgi:hypothetical protein